MFVARTVTSTATPTSLYDLLGLDSKRRNIAGVRLDLASGTVTWGDSANQPFAVLTTGELLPVGSLKDIYLAGVGDVDVAVFYHP